MPQPKAVIAYEDFQKLDLRVARVVEATVHPNADKLIVMQIDLGDERRQIIARLRGHCEPADLVGKDVVVVTNLQPRKMRGLESNGMLLAATVGEGEAMQVIVLTTWRPTPPGSPVS